MERYPSLIDHQGAYNISPEDYYGNEFDPAVIRPGDFIQNSPNLPVLKWSEIIEIKNGVIAFLVENGRFQGLRREDAARFYQFAPNDPSDRTLRVELENWSVLTDQFVLKMQQGILKNHPLWRILIIGAAPETCILIYPEAIRIGATTEMGNWKAALKNAKEKEAHIVYEREQFQIRQFEFCQKELFKEPKNLLPGIFKILGFFDNYNGNFNEKSIWILTSGGRENGSFTLMSFEEKDSISSRSGLAVNADGKIDTHFFQLAKNNIDPPYLLHQFIFEENFTGMAFLVKDHCDFHNGIRTVKEKWPILIDQFKVITDNELKKSIRKININGAEKGAP